MAKKNFIKKIKEKTRGFFEEEEYEDEEEEINLKTLIVVFLIGFVIIISIYLYINKGFEFMKPEFEEAEDREDMRQGNGEEVIQFEDYFMEIESLENSNFSEGMNHWSTSDGGELYKDSISKRTLNKGDYHSPPQSLQIDCFQPSCRIHYDIKPHSIVIGNPHNPKSGIWMGVKPGTKLKISYWYKGCDHVFSLMSYNKEGNFENFLEVEDSPSSTKWVEKKLITIIPDDEIAIGTEITINSEGTLLLDDIQLEKIE